MDILIDQVWKRYSTGWVLKDVSKHIKSGDRIAITGDNGSGKSTLIQIISGLLSSSKGKITYKHAGKEIGRDNVFQYCAISAAYAELEEELSIKEIFDHYQVFKPFKITDFKDFIELTAFEKQGDKQIRYFSSGMKQRLALGLALNMDVPLLILDEPTSFLDESKKSWYAEVMDKFTENKTVIIASNDLTDISTCTGRIEL